MAYSTFVHSTWFCSRRIKDPDFNKRHQLHAHNKDHPKPGILINEISPKVTVIASINAYSLRRKTTSSSYGERLE